VPCRKRSHTGETKRELQQAEESVELRQLQQAEGSQELREFVLSLTTAAPATAST